MQWSRSSVRFLLTKSKNSGLILVVTLLLLAACTSGGAQSTTVPTLTLIPSTATYTPVPPTTTPTRVPAIRPEALSTSVPRYLASLDGAEDQRRAGFAASDVLSRNQLDPLLLQLLVFEEWENPGADCLNDEDVSDGYRVIYQIQDHIYDYLITEAESLTLCQEADIREVNSELRLLIDPVAADLVILARGRVSREAAVDLEEVIVDEIVPRSWPDTSLGCPEAGVEYPEQRIDGYFIRLIADEGWYQLHTDFERAILCATGPLDTIDPDAESDVEVTPEVTVESTAEVEITPETTLEVEIEN